MGTQCLREEGILTPGRQVWAWTHAVRGITWMPGETDRKDYNVRSSRSAEQPSILFAQATRATQSGPPQQVKGRIPQVTEGVLT